MKEVTIFRSSWTRLMVPCGLMVCLALVSIIPGPTKPAPSTLSLTLALVPAVIQQIMHFVMYAALAYSWVWALETRLTRVGRMGTGFALSCAFGAGMEGLQAAIPGRYSSVIDMALNAAGALIGVIIATRRLRTTTRTGSHF